MTMLADLHIHTQYSDGTLTPEQAVCAAKKAGISLLAVCDHNTMAAWPRLRAACVAQEMCCVSGAEIDCVCDARSFATEQKREPMATTLPKEEYSLHILALNVDPRNPQLLALLHGCRKTLDDMSDDLIAMMEADGQAVSLQEYNEFTRNPAHGGWKGIDYLGTKGYPAQYPACMALYKRYAIAPRAAWPHLHTVCDVIHAAGGKAIVAHPGDRLPQEPKQLENALEILRQNGIDGAECYYPSHSAEVTHVCLAFCKAHQMCVTSGSDSHGDFAREIDGTVYRHGAACRDVSALRLDGIFPGKSY